MKQLDKLLFEQGGDCFFCGKPLAKPDASVEHLFAQANGGTSADENVVACCKTLNALLSNKPLKEKFLVVLRQKGAFRCPAHGASATPAPYPILPVQHEPPTVSVASRALPHPRKASPVVVAKLASVRQTPGNGSSVTTCPTCKNGVPVAVGQVDHVCPSCGGAFRY